MRATARARVPTPVFRKTDFKWLFTVCSLMNSAAAISRFDSPWASSAATSLSRSVSPKSWPGHAASPRVIEHWADDGLPMIDRDQRVRERFGRDRLGQYAARAGCEQHVELAGRELPCVHDDRADARVVGEGVNAIHAAPRVSVRVEEGDLDGALGIRVRVQLGHDETIVVRAEHPFEAAQYELEVVDECYPNP